MLLYLRLFKESFSFAINALTNNKLRTFLSLLGVTIGIFSIIAVLAAVDSLDRNIQDQLAGLDKNTIYLTKFSFLATDVPRWQRDNFPQTDYNDFDFIKRNVPDISESAYVIFGSAQTIKYESETISGVNVVPVSNGIYDINNIKIAEGRFYTESESINGSPVIVLGHSVAENLFGKANPLGKQIRVYGRRLTVIGVIKKIGGFGGNEDDSAYVPANFVRRFQSGGIGGIPGAVMIKPEKAVDMGAFEGALKQKFRAYRGLKAGDPDNFFVNKMSGQTDQIDAIIGTMNVMGWIISGFSLLVGGFGIANIMFVSVKERTNLIGIQKSLGAKNRFILFQFLFEAVILAVIGGLIGLFFVWIVSLIASQFTGDFEFVLSAGNMFLGFMLSTIIGLISGVIPAFSASRLDPVEAIRTGM